MVRSLGLAAGDKLVVIQSGDHLAPFPKHADFAEYIVGSMKGFWGNKEQIDRYVDDLGASPERDEAREEVYDLLAVDEVAPSVVNALGAAPQHVAALSDLASSWGAPHVHMVSDAVPTSTAGLEAAVATLVRLGAVRRIQRVRGAATRRVLRLAAAIRARTGLSLADPVVVATAMEERSDAVIGNDWGTASRAKAVQHLHLDDYVP